MIDFRRGAGLVTVLPLLVLGGCNTLPDSGPVEATILNDAKKPDTNPLGFRIIPLTPAVVGVAGHDASPSLTAQGFGLDAPNQDGRIWPGDTLQVSIFELGSGLFAGSAGGSLASGASGASNPLTGGPGPSASVTSDTLPPLVVDSGGAIDVPYIGRLHVAGRTSGQVASAIQAGLKGQSQNPQVLVRITSEIANSVIVSGDIKKPGRQELTMAHERLLDMVAIAGGPSHPPEDISVQLTRDGRTARIALTALQDGSDENVALLPGDRIQVVYRPKTFTVFGAANKVSETPFDAPELSLAEALARIGGPLDERADPNAVFLFRYEDSAVATSLGMAQRPGRQPIPVVYQLDMMSPTSYFVAQKFAMKDKDLLYIANAKTNKFYKFFTLISTIIGPGLTAAYLVKN